MTLYNGVLLFDILRPHMPDELSHMYSREMDVLTPPTGPEKGYSDALGDVGKYEFSFILESEAEIAALRTFITGTAKGRYGAFWIPTFYQDYVLNTDIASANTSIIINHADYTNLMYPLGLWRRHIAILYGGIPASLIPRKVSSTPSQTATTETLPLSSAVGVNLTTAQVLLSHLLLVRMESDEIAISHLSPSLATATFSVVELLAEYP